MKRFVVLPIALLLFGWALSSCTTFNRYSAYAYVNDEVPPERSISIPAGPSPVLVGLKRYFTSHGWEVFADRYTSVMSKGDIGGEGVSSEAEFKSAYTLYGTLPSYHGIYGTTHLSLVNNETSKEVFSMSTFISTASPVNAAVDYLIRNFDREVRTAFSSFP